MIKPCLWPRIEFFSSRGQESQGLRVIQQQPFIHDIVSVILSVYHYGYATFHNDEGAPYTSVRRNTV